MIYSYIHSYDAHVYIIHVTHFVCVYNVTQRCCNVIDTSLHPYCEYHVGSEMKKFNPKRANLQNWGNGGMYICNKEWLCVCGYVCVQMYVYVWIKLQTTEFSE